MKYEIGSLIIDLTGQELTPNEQDLLSHPLVGGVILFTRNYQSRTQLQTLCQQIRASRPTPLLIMVDQEGGRVQRFIPEFTRLPAMGKLGEYYTNHPEMACELAKDCGWLLATELLSVGVDLSLAPVLDLNKKMNQVIADRAFSAHPQTIVALAQAFIAGMQEAGMAATAKHFPGHGGVALDSHIALPTDERSLAAILQEDLVPFTYFIKNHIPAVMAAHIVFPQVDLLPVGFSRMWLQTILRDRLQFSGAIFSDDLNMEGANISANYADRFLAAREAGCNFILLCNNRDGVIQVLDQVSYESHLILENKWRKLAGDFSRTDTKLQHNQRWQQITNQLIHFTQINI